MNFILLNVLNSNLNAHANYKIASCGIYTQTTGTQFRTRALFYGHRGTALLLIKCNASADNLTINYSVYCFVYDRDGYKLERLAGDNVINVNAYSWSTDDIITVDFGGLNEWSIFDVISHRLIDISVIT